MVAKKFNNEYIALICSLFSYGRASQIVKFLNSLDFSLLEEDEIVIQNSLSKYYYRFQNSNDVASLFLSLKRMKKNGIILNDIFLYGYNKNNLVIEGINSLIFEIKKNIDYSSRGFNFLISKPFDMKKMNGSPYKRWNMFLRWMVRKDNIDLGLWNGVNTSDLIIPLDVHTFNVSSKIGLLKRKTYDFKAALELTESLKKFDSKDPIKYDFALYRIGQQNRFEL